MKIKYILPLVFLLFISCDKICEDIPIMDADVLIYNHFVETNKHTGEHKIIIDYTLTNIGTATITGWNITFVVNSVNGDTTLVGHTANPFHRSAFRIEPEETTEVLKLRRPIPSNEVTDVQLFEIVLK